MKDSRKQLQVLYKGTNVGTLALTQNGKVAFQYSKEWIKNGFSISPFSLPLTNEVYVPSTSNLDGLFGVFYDSLPDAWGKLIVDRTVKNKGIDLTEVNVLDRLAIVGTNGMGALEYVPEYNWINKAKELTIDELAEESYNLLNSVSAESLDSLFKAAGSSGGTRPKAFVTIDNEEWLIKFHYSLDEENSGESEYQYSLLARKCGINMSDTKLFPSKVNSGYFGTKRFDRPKVHMVSAAGLLEVDFNNCTCDYKDLIKLTNIITNANSGELKEMFSRMCFNVIFGNQDDHLKNFAFLYDDKHEKWHISPAFDLTRMNTVFNEHITTVNGKGKNIIDTDLIEVGLSCGLTKSYCIEKITEIRYIKEANTIISD